MVAFRCGTGRRSPRKLPATRDPVAASGDSPGAEHAVVRGPRWWLPGVGLADVVPQASVTWDLAAASGDSPGAEHGSSRQLAG
ncbi:hypothetical protein GCM10009827_028500 [Dactylosporangium maewongense]|uniref:Uncharacterized protein n=1 Tax=Dactylosporangium maewongense TaxID=634393 RepID=A0ABN2A7G0_9ACTN